MIYYFNFCSYIILFTLKFNLLNGEKFEDRDDVLDIFVFS